SDCSQRRPGRGDRGDRGAEHWTCDREPVGAGWDWRGGPRDARSHGCGTRREAMSSAGGLTDFFIREATEYIDRLRGLLAASMPGAPDGARFAVTARALRGSATMVRLDGFAELAGALERVGQETATGHVTWDVAMHAAAARAADDPRE